MTITLSIIVLLIILVLLYFINKKTNFLEQKSLENFDENVIETPIIQYSLYIIDVQRNTKTEIKQLNSYPNHFGILKGQYIELHWSILNANFMNLNNKSIYAIGYQSFFPADNTNYTFNAKNKATETKLEIFVHVFPTPILEKLYIPIPKFDTQLLPLESVKNIKNNTIDLPNKFNYSIPSILEFNKKLNIIHPTINPAIDFDFFKIKLDNTIKQPKL